MLIHWLLSSKFKIQLTKTHTLLIKEVDRKVFESIKDGSKTIETRAATEKYRKMKTGDILNFVCGSNSLQKRITSVRLFCTIEEMIGVLDIKSIMPFVDSVEAMRQVYYSFPNYEEKIKNFGIIAFEMEERR